MNMENTKTHEAGSKLKIKRTWTGDGMEEAYSDNIHTFSISMFTCISTDTCDIIYKYDVE